MMGRLQMKHIVRMTSALASLFAVGALIFGTLTLSEGALSAGPHNSSVTTTASGCWRSGGIFCR